MFYFIFKFIKKSFVVLNVNFLNTENGQPLPFPTHPTLTAALQCGPDGKLEGDTSLGDWALESCAFLAQSMLAHNFRDGPPISANEIEMFQVHICSKFSNSEHSLSSMIIL